jgi:hypothetical protein
MNTFDMGAAEEHFRELDVEIGQWGNPRSKRNAQYSVPPYYVPGNAAQFKEPSGTLTHILRWEPGNASFTTIRGVSSNGEGPVVSHHTFTSGVPSPGSEIFQLILYLVPSDRNPPRRENEVVIRKFEYLP